MSEENNKVELEEEEILGEDEDDDVIELIDDDGNVVNFYWVGTVEYEKNMYVAFEPSETHDDFEEGEVVIFKLDEDEEGNDVFSPIEDEKLLNVVFEEFLKLQEKEDGCDCENAEKGGCEGGCSCGCKK